MIALWGLAVKAKHCSVTRASQQNDARAAGGLLLAAQHVSVGLIEGRCCMQLKLLAMLATVLRDNSS